MEQLFMQVPPSSNMAPSAVRPDNSLTLDNLYSGPAGRQGTSYERMMQYLTQPKRDMGPAGRRAEAHMFAGPRDVLHDPVEMQATPGGSSLMALLFGGMR
jgi:hypothetical protein